MMYKQEFSNYGEKAEWARKWIKAKKRIPLTELDPNDLLVYQEIVEEILKNNNISKNEVVKHQKKMSEVFGLLRKYFTVKVMNWNWQ